MAFGYEVAGIGSRFVAALIDSLLIMIGLFLSGMFMFLILVSIEAANGTGRANREWLSGLVMAIMVILQFCLIWGYYIAFEIIWNGATPGKRAAGIRVVRTDGQPVGAVEVVVRNLVRIVDFLPSAYGIGVVTMFCSRQSRRLGDLAAGTLVIKERTDIRLATLSPARDTSEPDSTATARLAALERRLPNLRALRGGDLDLIRATLDRQPPADPELLTRLARAIGEKIGCPPLDDQSRQFLEDIGHLVRRRQEEREAL